MAIEKLELSKALLSRRDQLQKFFRLTNHKGDWEKRYKESMRNTQIVLKAYCKEHGCELLHAAQAIAEIREVDASGEADRRLRANIVLVAAVELITENDFTDGQ